MLPCMARGFSFIEILIVVAILGILAAIVVPRFTDANKRARIATAERTLQVLRHQIEYFRTKNIGDPDMINNQWDDLVQNDYLQKEPLNPMNLSTQIAGAPSDGIGWVWRDNGYGVFQIYATDSTYLTELTD